jgi:PAS domain S-box-containing protein
VLLADDNADMREYIRRLLEDRYEVVQVTNGARALEMARARRPDLVITDVMMPDLDGFGLLAALRGDAALRDVPVLMLSARAGEEARVEGLTAGADEYLVKPFSAGELVARVDGALGLASLRRETEARLDAINRELRQRVSELEALLEVLPIGIGISSDRACTTIRVNPAFAEALGLEPDANASKTAPEGSRPDNFICTDDAGREIPGSELPMQIAASRGEYVRGVEFNIVHRNGRRVRLLEYAAPLFDDRGEPRGSVGAFIDITDRRRVELRHAFLVRLDDATRSLADPEQITATCARLLGEHLGVSRCAYAEMADEGPIRIRGDFTRDVSSIVGEYPLAAFGDALVSRTSFATRKRTRARPR